MTGAEKRPRFQVSLLSAIGLMFVAAVALGFILSAILWWATMRDQYYYQNVAERCRKQMQEQVDLGGIRAWMATGTRDGKIWPTCIGTLRFDGLEGSPSCEGTSVRVTWGSGFGHWGIVVGPETMPVPASTRREYILTLAPGAYVWHEIQ